MYWVAWPFESTTCKTYEDTGWYDTPLINEGQHSSGTTAIYGRNQRPNAQGVDRDCWWYNEQIRWVDNTDLPIYTNQWRYRELSNTYFFYKWLEWSQWQETPITANQNKEVEIKKMYRYKRR